uniref:von Willebrand factor C domain-containing protein 2-like protein n=2 Tax=Magallana gigas TaxID=29159 RepID=A0A8W8MDB0_MAGGI|nr:von Willebrand factor C domain-containing protein 2-like [Crassostrea gigas]
MIGLAVFALLLSYGQCGLLTQQLLTPTLPSGCYYHGSFYPLGWFRTNPCDSCMCYTRGYVSCAFGDCIFPALCADPVHEKDKCCPTCPNGYTCKAPDGHIVKAGETYHLNSYTSCQCDSHRMDMYNFSATCTEHDPSIP